MKIYFEQQESALCGQHCLNNLLQAPVFTASQLSEIALSLDQREQSLLSSSSSSSYMSREGSHVSNNVDEMGNFSLEVLMAALKVYSIQLLNWASEEESHIDPLQEKIGFIINRQQHWFSLRKIGKNWWNLNSTLSFPEVITSFSLSAFLAQLRADGYFVFIARGNLPSFDTEDEGDIGGGKWIEEKDLLQGEGNGNNKPVLVPFSGAGRKLGHEGQEEAEDVFVSSGDAFEDDMARAIRLSISQEKEENKKPPTKEEIRMKRLAALGGNKEK